MSKTEAEGPKKFDVVFRGYARGPVDEYVARLHGWLLDSEARADNAVKAAAASVGDRVNDILRTAMEAGEEARQSAEAKAAKLLQEAEERAGEAMRFAERRAEQVRERAEESAREIEQAKAEALAQAERAKAEALAQAEQAKSAALARAEADAQRRRKEAHDEIEALKHTISQLDEKKQHTLDELARLQAFLAGAPDVGASAAATEVTATSDQKAANADKAVVTAKPGEIARHEETHRNGGITAAPDKAERPVA